jgi:hypothetical protein
LGRDWLAQQRDRLEVKRRKQMMVNDYGAYIEEARDMKDADDFVSFNDEHGVHIMLSKDIVREAYALLTTLGEENEPTT